jgi:hypothetical protein
MIRIARAAVFMFAVLGLVASVARTNPLAHNHLTAILDGTQPPVPPKASEVAALMLDGTQPPVPPKAAFFDGTQPPVPPKKTGAAASMFDGTQPPVRPKALAAAVQEAGFEA